jgi:hypothetical protein
MVYKLKLLWLLGFIHITKKLLWLIKFLKQPRTRGGLLPLVSEICWLTIPTTIPFLKVSRGLPKNIQTGSWGIIYYTYPKK